MVTLNFPENVDLQVLIDYVGKRNGINFIFDEQISGRRVTIRANQPIPASSLMTLVESALRMKGLTLSPTEVPNVIRVEQSPQLTSRSLGPDQVLTPEQAGSPTLAITRVLRLRHVGTQRAMEVIGPFLSGPSANVIPLQDQGTLILTDFASNMARLDALLATVDQPGKPVAVRFVPVKHMEITAAEQRLTQLLTAQARLRGGPADPAASGVVVVPETRTSQMVLMGQDGPVNEAQQLLETIDVPLGLETRAYSLRTASPSQLDRNMRALLGAGAADRIYRSVVERESNLLLVSATSEIHEQVRMLADALDKPQSETQSPVRFYRLENARAPEVLETLRGIEGEEGLSGLSIDGVVAQASQPQRGGDEGSQDGLVLQGPTGDQINAPPGAGDGSDDASERRRGAVRLRDARIMADEPTNTLIVIARPSMHEVYERLIKRLDVRRPQVLIEATIVAIDTTNDFKLGVEIHGSDEANNGTLLNFTQFGLTTEDSTPGDLTLSPGTGFTGALLNADVVEFVIRALESDSRVRVVSRPSVLVNDNAQGVLESETEEPFASVNASNTVATTSLGGFASAGTTITVTPQISQGDYLNLKYEVNLSSFVEGSSSENLPPTRQTNSLVSEATIPDGYTIVVGGLTRENINETVDRIPLLGRIPLVEYLFSSRSTEKQQTTLFVFIRAVILRDDQFRDLKVVSGTAARDADVSDELPRSEPAEIR